MKRMEADKGKIPVITRERKTRFSDNYQSTQAVDRRTASSRGRGGHEIQTEDRNQQQQHRSISKNSLGEEVKKTMGRHANLPEQLTQRASSERLVRINSNVDRGNSSSSRPYPSSSSTGGGTNPSPKLFDLMLTEQKCTSTKISRPRYKFHSDKNGNFEENSTDDEEEETELHETSASKDLNLSLSPQNNGENPEPEPIEEEGRQAIVTRDTVDPVSSGCKSSKDGDLVDPPDIQTREVDEPEPDDDDDDSDVLIIDEPEPNDDDDLDVLIIDLTDEERAEMESWAN